MACRWFGGWELAPEMAERSTNRWLLLAGLGLSGLVAAAGLLQLAEPAAVSLPARAAASASVPDARPSAS